MAPSIQIPRENKSPTVGGLSVRLPSHQISRVIEPELAAGVVDAVRDLVADARSGRLDEEYRVVSDKEN